MAGITAIQGVDDTLRDLATQAVAGLAPPISVTVGPLDRDDDEPRVNWFLYQLTPNMAYANMEPPRTGWRTARGRPPLALQLHYLLSAHPGALTANGDEDQFSHRALAAVMRALHDNAIVDEADPRLSTLAKPLVEPLRISSATLDLDAISKIWTAAARPMRLSVGYEVSLVVIDTLDAHVAGPPVQLRRVAVAPTMGPRVVSLSADRVSAGVDVLVRVEGLTGTAVFTLGREPGDPPGPPAGWPFTVTPNGPDAVTIRLVASEVPAGERHIEVTATADGLLVGRDAVGVNVVPVITGHTGTVTAGATVQLTTAHATADVEVFLAGVAVPPAAVVFLSATQVDVTIPAGTPPGPIDASLRSAKLAGPIYGGMTAV